MFKSIKLFFSQLSDGTAADNYVSSENRIGSRAKGIAMRILMILIAIALPLFFVGKAAAAFGNKLLGDKLTNVAKILFFPLILLDAAVEQLNVLATNIKGNLFAQTRTGLSGQQQSQPVHNLTAVPSRSTSYDQGGLPDTNLNAVLD